MATHRRQVFKLVGNDPGQCISIFPDYETFGEHHVQKQAYKISFDTYQARY